MTTLTAVAEPDSLHIKFTANQTVLKYRLRKVRGQITWSDEIRRDLILSGPHPFYRKRHRRMAGK